MNKRATVWLFAALLALCAGGAAPVLRAGQVRERTSIVWTARLSLETPRKSPRVLKRTVRRTPPREFRAASPLLAKSLYQRPPPFSLG